MNFFADLRTDLSIYRLYLKRWPTATIYRHIAQNYPRATYPSFALFRIVADVHIVQDPALAREVLMRQEDYDRASANRRFADAFAIENVFTTRNEGYRTALRSQIAVSVEQCRPERVAALADQVVARQLQGLLDGQTAAKFDLVEFVETAALRLFAGAYLGVGEFASAAAITRRIKELWRLKTKMTKFPHYRFNPLIRRRARVLRAEIEHLLLDLGRTDDALRNVEGSWSRYRRIADRLFGEQTVDDEARRRRENLLNVLIPGYETLARAVTFLLLELARRPDLDRRSRRELQQRETPFLDALWKETLRHYPPNPTIYREALRDTPRFRKGAQIGVCVEALHHAPEAWRQPDRFDPDRFLTGEGAAAEARGFFMPFSVGRSACVATQFSALMAKALVTSVLRAVRLSFGQTMPPVNFDNLRGPHGKVVVEAIRVPEVPKAMHATPH